MKMRILTAVTMVILIGAAAFGLVKRQTYTDLCGEENYLDGLYVAEAISPLTEKTWLFCWPQQWPPPFLTHYSR